jgi:Tol biopolymer transport system component
VEALRERRAAVSSLDGSSVSRLDLDSAKTTVVLSNADPKESVENFRVSEDGRKLIFSSRNSETSAVNLLMLDLSSGDVRKLTSDRVSRL